MKFLLTLTFVSLSWTSASYAIPQNFFGGGNIFGATFKPKSIDEDLTENLVADSVWLHGKLPRLWKTIPSLDGNEVKMFSVNPIVFGQHPTAVFANSEKGNLKSIAILYLDAGHFFGYRPSPGDKKDIKSLQREFKKQYEKLESELKKTLRKYTNRLPDDAIIGRTDFLRNTYQDYEIGDLMLRLSTTNGQTISLIIIRREDISKSYLNLEIAALNKRDRQKKLQENVSENVSGDTSIDGIPMFQQGQRPYCAISTLGMATHYLGLRLGTDALAAGARFRNTGSAKGSKMLDLYRAAAEESGATLQRGRSFDFSRAQKYIEKGFPIVVWRRYSSQRNRLHSAAARGMKLPEATSTDRSTWPTSKDDPGHASVVTGFNKSTGEVIFMESWGEHARSKRMRAAELEATSYATFYFKI